MSIQQIQWDSTTIRLFLTLMERSWYGCAHTTTTMV